jgi:hypothetical protein
MADSDDDKKTSGSVKITVAIISSAGLVIAAVITNWDKINPSPKIQTDKLTPIPNVSLRPKTPTPKTPNTGQPTVVWIHIFTESQRVSAVALQRKLNDSGYSATAEIEKTTIDKDSPGQATIRYFHEKDLISARDAKNIMSKEIGYSVQLEPSFDIPDNEKAPSGTIEIWYPSRQ